MSNYEKHIQSEVVLDLVEGYIECSNTILSTHGNDPDNDAILATAIVEYIGVINSINTNVRKIILEMLQDQP